MGRAVAQGEREVRQAEQQLEVELIVRGPKVQRGGMALWANEVEGHQRRPILEDRDRNE
jgi:hypothetical protein